MLPLSALGLALAAGVLAGLLIGSIGVGGIVIVPIIIQLDVIDVQTAIAAAMVSYTTAGLVGMLMYARKNSIEWGSTFVLLAASAPAAFGGSYFLKDLSDMFVKLVLYALVLLSSILALVRTMQARSAKHAAAAAEAEAKPATSLVASTDATPAEVDGLVLENVDLAEEKTTPYGYHTAKFPEGLGTGRGLKAVAIQCAVGVITGFGSAITGTSGPVCACTILLPTYTLSDLTDETHVTRSLVCQCSCSCAGQSGCHSGRPRHVAPPTTHYNVYRAMIPFQ